MTVFVIARSSETDECDVAISGQRQFDRVKGDERDREKQDLQFEDRSN
jgi:hypothetical protein